MNEWMFFISFRLFEQVRNKILLNCSTWHFKDVKSKCKMTKNTNIFNTTKKLLKVHTYGCTVYSYLCPCLCNTCRIIELHRIYWNNKETQTVQENFSQVLVQRDVFCGMLQEVWSMIRLHVMLLFLHLCATAPSMTRVVQRVKYRLTLFVLLGLHQSTGTE